MIIEPPTERAALSPELMAEREAFYGELPQFGMKPLWTVLGDALTPEPRVKSVPYIWRWRDVRPGMLRAGERVTAEEAERRVLMLLNPGLEGRIAATSTLFTGMQLILPGEVAPTHHHTPSAIRFIVEGEGAYTAVNGEKSLMSKGDYLTTPNWTWHDHGNESEKPMIWLDGLDLPFVRNLDAIFYEEFPEDRQPISKPLDDSIRRWGPNLPTMAAYLQLLRRDEHTKAHRHVASTVYHVAEGGGYSIIASARFDWEEGDTFVIPAWAWHEHASDNQGEAVLFSFSDRPILQAFGLD